MIPAPYTHVLPVVRFTLAGLIPYTQCVWLDGKRRDGSDCNFCNGCEMLARGDELRVRTYGYLMTRGLMRWASVGAEIIWPWAHDRRERITTSNACVPAFGEHALEHGIMLAATDEARSFASAHRATLLIRSMEIESDVRWPAEWERACTDDGSRSDEVDWLLAKMDGAR